MCEVQLPPTQQQTCREIITLLDMAQGFELIFIECNAPATQQQAEQYLRAHSPHRQWVPIVFDDAIRNVREELLERKLTLTPQAVISLRGLEHSIQQKQEAADVVARLNVARDVLPTYFPCPLLLWLPFYALHHIARFAPDLWSWRAAVFSFDPQPQDTPQSSTQMTAPIGSTTSVDNYSKAFKEAEIDFLTPILEAFDPQTAAPNALRKHAKNAFLLAEYHYSLGHYQEALFWFKQAKSCLQQIGDEKNVAECQQSMGVLYTVRGAYEAALQEYQASLQIKEKLGDQAGIAATRNNIGMIHQNRGDHEAALQEYETSLQIFEDLGNQARIAATRHNIGVIHQDRGDYEAALQEYEASLRINEALGNQAGIAATRHQPGNIYYLRGDYEAALQEYQANLQIKEKLGDQYGIALTRGQIASIDAQRGDYAAAFEGLFYALTTLTQLQSPDAHIVMKNLKHLRYDWGAAPFDAAWQAATGEAAPDWVRNKEQGARNEEKGAA